MRDLSGLKIGTTLTASGSCQLAIGDTVFALDNLRSCTPLALQRQHGIWQVGTANCRRIHRGPSLLQCLLRMIVNYLLLSTVHLIVPCPSATFPKSSAPGRNSGKCTVREYEALMHNLNTVGTFPQVLSSRSVSGWFLQAALVLIL